MISIWRTSVSAMAMLALATGTLAGAAPKRKPAPKAAPKPAIAAEPSPASLYRPTTGCPVAPAGKYAAAVAVPKKERGKSPIEQAPRIATVKPAEICSNREKISAMSGSIGGPALGLSSQVLNTQAGRSELIAIPAVETQLQKTLLKYTDAWPYARPQTLPRILFQATEGYSAMALPDNSIVLSLGLLEAAESDSEVLFVLAHEYSHILMGHHAAALSGQNGKDVGNTLGALYTAGSLVSQLRVNSGGLSVANRSKVETAAKRAAVVSEALRFAVDELWSPNYSRDQEYEADAVAMDLLIGSNQTIDSYTNVFGRLQKLFEKRATSREKSQAKANALQKNLADTMKEVGSPEFLTSVGLGNTSGLKSLGGKMALGVGMSVLGSVVGGKSGGDTHPPPEERRKALSGYFQAGYPTADPPIDAGVMIGLIKSMPEFKNAVALRNNYAKARDAYAAQDFAGSITGLRALGAGTRSAPTFVNYLAGLAARELGDRVQAESFYEAGRTGSGLPSALLQESFAQLRIDNKDLPGSRALLDDANVRFRDPDHFRSLEIARYVAAGDITSAQSNYNSCLAVQGRDYIPPRCKSAYPQAEAAAPEKKKLKLPGIPNPF